MQTLDKNKYVVGLFIDLQKAFDCIDIDILLIKLYRYGVRGLMFEWLKDYLRNRVQYTFVNGIKSDVSNISYGVPQGSVLGPLLFLIYVNDMHKATPDSTPKLFADDTNVFIVADNLRDLSIKSNNCLSKIHQWCLANRLSINLDKTNYTVFSPKRNASPDDLQLYIGDFQIKYTSCCKYLGILIDNRLNWQEHIEYVYKKILKFCGIFYKIRDLLPPQCLRMVYYSFVHSHILYGIEIYANTCSTYLNHLTILNNKLIRILFNKNKYTHVKDLYKIIDSLPILKLHEFVILTFVHKCIFRPVCLPDIFSGYFSSSNLVSNYNSRRKHDLYINHFNTSFGRKCLKIKGCFLWNNIPNNIKSLPDNPSFCREIKFYLLNSEVEL